MADFVGADFGGSAMFRQRDFMAENLIPFQKHVLVCQGEAGTRNGSAAVKARLVKNRAPSAEPK